ncbi:phosphorylase b kinase regulatory subunit beta-like [Anneissia japonica]|uniref:phosphorylase b kinase regulatory subunit beta-like n=1 Tax=Anneissia japonica TaxID=1529436 RepID=UPI0014258662|nr:phosphorylase b kinase regulatory subunit beta-like [Anneissia japonica]
MSKVAKDAYSELVKRLDDYYHIVKNQILHHQCPTIGMFPSDTGGNEIKVRDSVYCAAAIWSLALAYRKIDNDQGRTYELEQSAVKCMRGILYCYLRQADKVEKFKKDQNENHALHSKFVPGTGDALSGRHRHLQIDAVSLFLLYIVQMISSGLHIIYSMEEVVFIQNIVYYVERAYRTPDYGMWERGSKYNTGKCELHASSVGMAKAALEAINGFNLFGKEGTTWSVVYVDVDAHFRNQTIMESLLPRESSSKNTDASLLPMLSFPSFAIDNQQLCKRTKEKVLRKLEGKYGMKRFLRDGFSCVLEDKNRRYYRQAEIKLFDGIESEWPMFYAYMVIDGVAKGDEDQVEEYYEKMMSSCIETKDGGLIMPKCFIVPGHCVDEEKAEPGSQRRYPSNNDKIFLWGQSILIIAQLLKEKLVDMGDVDPIGRYLGNSAGRKHKHNTRYSAFEGTPPDLTVQMVLIAESARLQATLATYGIVTQTPTQVEPIEIWPPSELVKAYSLLGFNEKLGLTGRPPRPVGSLGTSKIYRVLGRTVLCYPLTFDRTDFYMSEDISLLVDDIKSQVAFVRNSWKMSGRPTFCILIREDHFRGSQKPEMLDMLVMFKRGGYDGVHVRVDRLQTLLASSFIEHLDFQIPLSIESSLDFRPLEELNVSHFPLKALEKRVEKPQEQDSEQEDQDYDFHLLDHKSTWEITEELQKKKSIRWESTYLALLMKREGPNHMTQSGTVGSRLDSIYRKAGMQKDWFIVRFCASHLRKVRDSLAPAITSMLVRGKQVTIGVFGHEEAIITKPLPPAEIASILYNKCQMYDIREPVLQQEVIYLLGKFISNEPHLFDGMLKVRVGWIVHAMRTEYAFENGTAKSFYTLSPSQIKDELYRVLSTNMMNLGDRNWMERRKLNGALNRTPPNFYDKVLDILARTPAGITIAGSHLPQQPTLSEMTRTDLDFALRIEEMLCRIRQPEYRQIMVELLTVIATILKRNPEVEFSEKVDMDGIINDALCEFQKDRQVSESEGCERMAFYNTPSLAVQGTTSYLAKVVVKMLLNSSMDSKQADPCTVS